MKTLFLILISAMISLAGEHMTSDINSVFLHNHKSLGEFIRSYGTYTNREVKIVKTLDVLTGKKYDVAKTIYEYTNFTYMAKGKIIIRLDVIEDPILGDHQVSDIVVIIEGKPYRHFYKG